MPDETQSPPAHITPDTTGTLDPPTTLGGILKQLGLTRGSCRVCSGI